MTVDEHAQHMRDGQLRAETDEYRAYVREVHAAAGLDPPDEPRTGEDMTAEDHYREMRPR